MKQDLDIENVDTNVSLDTQSDTQPAPTHIKRDTFIQFIKFGLVGVSNTVISYLIYAVVYTISDNYLLASVISWLISVLNAFFWQNLFVFKQEEGKKRVWWKALLRTYAAYAFTGLILNNILLWLWIDVVDIGNHCTWAIELLGNVGIVLTAKKFSGYFAQIINLFINVPINFVINKFWAYEQ